MNAQYGHLSGIIRIGAAKHSIHSFHNVPIYVQCSTFIFQRK